ncbi:MAG: M48 family metalloprotease [Salinisphaeraceae bacterium]
MLAMLLIQLLLITTLALLFIVPGLGFHAGLIYLHNTPPLNHYLPVVSVEDLLWWSCLAMAAAYVLILLRYLFASNRRVARHIAGVHDLVELPEKHGATQMGHALARSMGIRIPRFYLMASPVPNAFALQSTGRDCVVITGGLAATLSPDALRWVIAHELAHLCYRDAAIRSFWLTVIRSLYSPSIFLASMKQDMARSGWWRPGTAFVLLPLTFPMEASGWMATIARRLYLVLDGPLSRRAEWRADAMATRYTGAAAGVEALGSLSFGLEHSIDVWSSHPPTPARIAHIREQGGL